MLSGVAFGVGAVLLARLMGSACRRGSAFPPENVPIYTQIFSQDPMNIWAYTNLINYHLYENEEFDTALDIAQRALYSNPGNEKICFDLAKLKFFRNEYIASREYALRSVALNGEMDISYDLLADTSNEILNEVPGVNRVLYDISTKPPASIEWE